MTSASVYKILLYMLYNLLLSVNCYARIIALFLPDVDGKALKYLVTFPRSPLEQLKER